MKHIFGYYSFTQEEKEVMNAALEVYATQVKSTAHHHRSEQQWLKPLNAQTLKRHKELGEEIKKV